MSNIFQMLNAQNNPMLQKMNMIKNMMNGSPQTMFENMLNTNPQFQQFYNANKNKTIEQIASENGIDYQMFKSFLG